MFQGDMEQWVRFANTIKLRIAIRESNTTEIAAIYAEGSGFIDDVLVNPGYLKMLGNKTHSGIYMVQTKVVLH
jgi:hypothetical protein